jgi:hypothetical protein
MKFLQKNQTMNHPPRLTIPLVIATTLLIFSCNQQQQKTETTDSTVVSGAFDRTILPILPHPFA